MNGRWHARPCACSNSSAGCTICGRMCIGICLFPYAVSCAPTNWMPAWMIYHNVCRGMDARPYAIAYEWTGCPVGWTFCRRHCRRTACRRCGSSCVAPIRWPAWRHHDKWSIGRVGLRCVWPNVRSAFANYEIVCRTHCTDADRRLRGYAYAALGCSNWQILCRRSRIGGPCVWSEIAYAPV